MITVFFIKNELLFVCFNNLSYLGRVVDECKLKLLDLKDRNVFVKFVKRPVNKLAHYLSKIQLFYC